MEAWLRFCFWPKTNSQAKTNSRLSWCVIMVQNPNIRKKFLIWAERYCQHHYPKSFSSLLQYFYRLLTRLSYHDRLYHNWTCVLFIADPPNANVNILLRLCSWTLIPFFFCTKLNQYLWSIFRIANN